MKLSRNQMIMIGVGVVVLAVGVWFFFLRDPCSGKDATECGEKSDKCTFDQGPLAEGQSHADDAVAYCYKTPSQ